MTTRARCATDAGITLVEMLVALAIFALVGVTSFTTLDTICSFLKGQAHSRTIVLP